MKKKYIAFGLIGVFAMVLVSAAVLSYYGQTTQTINVVSPVVFLGDETSSVDGSYAGQVLVGDGLGMRNDATFAVPMIISDNSDLTRNNGIETSYFGNLELTKKDVDFTLDKWNVISGKVQIKYTIFGDEFSAEVVEGEIKGYELVYYKDNSDRFNEPAEAILVEGNSFPYLPYQSDKNSEFADEYDYCDTTEYVTCHGAKIWYVPSNAIPGGVIDWARAGEFYFESSLIQYNADGQITVYPGELLDFTPEFDVSLLFTGTADITTTVTPVTA